MRSLSHTSRTASVFFNFPQWGFLVKTIAYPQVEVNPPAEQHRSNKAPYFTTLKFGINRSDLS